MFGLASAGPSSVLEDPVIVATEFERVGGSQPLILSKARGGGRRRSLFQQQNPA
jgi:hypothetical protein